LVVVWLVVVLVFIVRVLIVDDSYCIDILVQMFIVVLIFVFEIIHELFESFLAHLFT